ncbi:hypothetical protein [Nitrosomonas sp. Nm33]|uniref:hypothetical protein n=1 Tax=Nitrosomonas sp. Nm33 TaxID=133724 RepID=UPI000B8446E9|nr:hypothetical protein [Nitrosomonas sp. Nm33]
MNIILSIACSALYYRNWVGYPLCGEADQRSCWQIPGLWNFTFLVSIIFIGFDPENLSLKAVASFEGVAGIALSSIATLDSFSAAWRESRN